MKAMIFAAGLGTRLRPLTDTMPKALIPVAGVPMLERVIRRMIDAGFDDITINVHHFASMIVDFLRDNNDFGITIHISDESECLLDTGGGILHARQWLDGTEPILVHNADILTDLNLSDIYRRHIDAKADATLLVDRRDTSRHLLFDNDNRLCGWTNTSTGEVRPDGFSYNPEFHTRLAFGGIHVISPTLFPALASYSPSPVFSIIPCYLNIAGNMNIRGYTPDAPYTWHDIGKPSSLAAANNHLRQ